MGSTPYILVTTRSALIRIFAIIATAILIPLFSLNIAQAAPRSNCTPIEFPITIGNGTGSLSGTLCSPPGARSIQILVPGLGYGQYYYDFPYHPETYSYVHAANSAGYATLNVDRLGTGSSWHPPSTSVTFNSNADALHQVIQAARAGVSGITYDKFALVAHSTGTEIAYLEAEKYHDVDALVATGGAHSLNYANTALRVGGTSIPSILDPKFTSQGYDPGYVTTLAGGRSVYYHRPNTDPSVIGLDEKLKTTDTLETLLTELPPIGVRQLTRQPQNISIPTFTINGQKDPFFCASGAADCSSSSSLADSERPFYESNATVEAQVIPDSGHALFLERSAPKAYSATVDFLDRHIGS